MYICIEGNIGVGKTTLAEAIAKKLDADFLPERFEDNTLLPLFYNHPKKFAFPTEYSFLIDRQKQLITYFKVPSKNKFTVSDFHFDKCICFAQTNLSSQDFLFYKKHFKAIQKTVPLPDLIVYLTSSPEQLMKNIKSRGRTIEKKLKKEYLDRLRKTFDDYYTTKRKINAFVLVIPIEEYNSSTTEMCCQKILQTINMFNR